MKRRKWNYVSYRGYTIMGRQRSGNIQNQSLKESLPFGLNEDYMSTHSQNDQ